MQDEQIKIKANTSNYDKQQSYANNFTRFNKAKKAECYLECIWILYSMLEDRTSAFLYYSGFVTGEF